MFFFLCCFVCYCLLVFLLLAISVICLTCRLCVVVRFCQANCCCCCLKLLLLLLFCYISHSLTESWQIYLYCRLHMLAFHAFSQTHTHTHTHTAMQSDMPHTSATVCRLSSHCFTVTSSYLPIIYELLIRILFCVVSIVVVAFRKFFCSKYDFL